MSKRSFAEKSASRKRFRFNDDSDIELDAVVDQHRNKPGRPGRKQIVFAEIHEPVGKSVGSNKSSKIYGFVRNSSFGPPLI